MSGHLIWPIPSPPQAASVWTWNVNSVPDQVIKPFSRKYIDRCQLKERRQKNQRKFTLFFSKGEEPRWNSIFHQVGPEWEVSTVSLSLLSRKARKKESASEHKQGSSEDVCLNLHCTYIHPGQSAEAASGEILFSVRRAEFHGNNQEEKYRVGPKVYSSYSIISYRRTWVNFLPNIVTKKEPTELKLTRQGLGSSSHAEPPVISHLSLE